MTYLLPHQAPSWSFQASLKHMPQDTCASWQLLSQPCFSVLPIDILSQLQQPNQRLLCWLHRAASRGRTSQPWHTGTREPGQNDSRGRPGPRLIASVSAADIIRAAGGLLPSVSSPKWELKSTERLQQAFWTSASCALFQNTKGREFTFKSRKVIFARILFPQATSR